LRQTKPIFGVFGLETEVRGKAKPICWAGPAGQGVSV
jgi:hypothetical protein